VHHDGAQRPGAGLEAFFIRPDIAVEVGLKQLIKPSALGMSWLVGSQRLRNDPSGRILGRTGKGDDRLVAEGHGGQ
jgi:hypothetical protein